MGLAQTSAAMGLYDKSLSVLDRLTADFPENYTSALTRAKVLSWSARYGDAVDAYDALYQKNPDNHVVLTEAARTAYWGKMADTGNDYYQRIYTPSIEKTRTELDYLYQIQKKAYLEHQSKRLSFNRRFAPAQRQLEALLETDAGNQEALFELAQVYCALGLCDQEKQVYEDLLTIDPLHGQADIALDRQRIRSRPQIFGAYSFWREEGRGDLAQMARHRADLGIKLSVNCRHKLQVVAHRYVESPLKHADTVEASGLGIQGELVTGPFLSLSGGITRKAYEESLQITDFSRLTNDDAAPESFRKDLEDITLGHLSAAVNLDNYARLEMGYKKAEELVNPVALAQGDLFSNHSGKT
ncbi:MAG: hypothetical protein U9P10_10585 [Thermodesulfobacteriota bacterium]|nr:hypothetical protein [Thermodesulfobacteriota bacterium]